MLVKLSGFKFSPASLGTEELRPARKRGGYSKKYNLKLVSRDKQPLEGGGFKLRLPWYRKNALYSDCLIPPVMRWFPSRRTAFNLKGNVDSDAVISLFPRKINASVWYNHKRKTFAVLVPKPYAERAKHFLGKKFRYEPRKDLWIVRTYRRRKRHAVDEKRNENS